MLTQETQLPTFLEAGILPSPDTKFKKKKNTWLTAIILCHRILFCNELRFPPRRAHTVNAALVVECVSCRSLRPAAHTTTQTLLNLASPASLSSSQMHQEGERTSVSHQCDWRTADRWVFKSAPLVDPEFVFFLRQEAQDKPRVSLYVGQMTQFKTLINPWDTDWPNKSHFRELGKYLWC